MNSLAINAVGVGAALCSMTSFVPQIVKIVRERDASAVPNVVNLGLAGTILGLKWRLSGGRNEKA